MARTQRLVPTPPTPTLLEELRAALAQFRRARRRLPASPPGTCALVRDGKVELVGPRRADALRGGGPAAGPLLLVELDSPRGAPRLTFLAAPLRRARA